MHQYETGQRSPKAAMLEKLAAVLDVSAAAFWVPDIFTRMEPLVHYLTQP